MSSLAGLMDATESLAALISSLGVTEGFLPRPVWLMNTLATVFGRAVLIIRAEGEHLEEVEHGLGEDVANGFQLGEGALENSLDLVLGRSNKAGEGLPLPGDVSEVSKVLGGMNLGDGVFMDNKESGDGDGVLLIGPGLPEGEFGEVGDEKRIEDHCLSPPGGHKGEEINVVAARGFHSNDSRGEFFAIGRYSFKEFGEAMRVHISRYGEAKIPFRVKPRGGKRILGYINSNEKIIQSSTSVKRCCGKAGEASRPILHDDKGSLTQSTYNGYGRQGTDSFKGSTTQVTWSSPAFPSFACPGKTRSLNKRYTTNSM